VLGAVGLCFNGDLLALSTWFSVTFGYVEGELCGKRNLKGSRRYVLLPSSTMLGRALRLKLYEGCRL